MFLSDPEWQAVLLSLKVSSTAVLLSLPFGIFFWLLVRRDFPGKRCSIAFSTCRWYYRRWWWGICC